MSRTCWMAGLAALGTIGCATGPSMREFTAASTPGGARVTISLDRSRTVHGELLAVEDTAVFLALRIPEVPGSGETSPLVRIPIRSIRDIQGSRRANGGWTDRNRNDFRAISRYPGGVDGALERRLMTAYGVDSIVWLLR